MQPGNIPFLRMHRDLFRYITGLLLFWATIGVYAQVLQGSDDQYGIRFGKILQVETYGVLENDSLSGEPAGENGATAELISSPGYGTLSCPTDAGLALCADGSFDYTTATGFNGIDSFTYQAVFDGTVSAPVTVKLTACTGGPQIFTCWKEAAYLSKLAELGFGVVNEGFEGVAWDVARTAIPDPNTVASLISQGITWTSNHPETNNITTSSGAARSGNWGGYDAGHGVATGTPGNCDIDDPPVSCLYHDGLSGKTQPDGAVLHGVGAFIDGMYGGKMAVILDGGTPISLGLTGFYDEQFHGVIDSGSSGFSEFEFREVDGKAGQALYVWFDDFRIAAADAPTNIAPVADAGSDQAVSVGEVVTLDGSASFDANSDSIAYNWSLMNRPAASLATLSDPTSVSPTFVADVTGYYTAELVVSDTSKNSAPDTVDIGATPASSNVLPVADAGADQAVLLGDIVLLDGSASSDANGDPLIYGWTLAEMPAGSTASLSNPGAINPGFVADMVGRYVARLVVSDAVGDSPPDSVEINAATAMQSCQFYIIKSKTGKGAVVCL